MDTKCLKNVEEKRRQDRIRNEILSKGSGLRICLQSLKRKDYNGRPCRKDGTEQGGHWD
jgi:hypothetical protein